MSIELKIINPDISSQPQTRLSSAASDGDTTLTVDSTEEFSANDYIVLGTVSSDKTEILLVTGVTDDTTLALSVAVKFDHALEETVQATLFNQIQLYKADDDAGTGETLLSTSAIDFENQYNITVMYDTGTSANKYYRSRYYNSTTSTGSEYSDYLSGDTTSFCTVESVYQKTGMKESVVPYETGFLAVKEAEEMVKTMYKNTFLPNQTDTILLNGDGDRVIFIPDRYLPITSITSLKQLDQSGAEAYSFAGTEYQYDATTGMIRLRESVVINQLERAFINDYSNVEVVFEHGYSSIPVWISDLVRSLAGLNVINYKITGSYTDVSTWSVEGMSYSLGQPYVNLDAGFRRLQQNVDRIIAMHKPIFIDDEGE